MVAKNGVTWNDSGSSSASGRRSVWRAVVVVSKDGSAAAPSAWPDGCSRSVLRLAKGSGVMGDPGDLAAKRAEQLIAWASDLLRADGYSAATQQAIADAVRQLGSELVGPDPALERALSGLHGAGAAATVLARAADAPALMLARFPSDAPTPVHNHNSWGIVCVVRGRDRYLRWNRLDDGSDPEHAQVALVQEIELGVGDVTFLGEPPGDIHSQQGVDGPVWELVFFGRDPDSSPRTYFDPDTGTVTYGSSAR